MKYIVNLSGGKDSTAMLLMLLDRGEPIDYILFADTGKDFPQMHDHLKQLAKYIKQHYPDAPYITTLKADKSFDYLMFEHVKTKGKRIGSTGYGWATMRARWCTAKLKTAVIDRFCKSLGDDYTHYIGIAVDEPKRLKSDPHKIYPLANWNITEAAALAYCYERGFDWGGLYKHFDRVSCWCCPLKNLRELKTLWKFYPELWAELRAMDERAYNQFRADYSVADLEQKFKSEEETVKDHQISIFETLNIPTDPTPKMERAKKRKWENAFQKRSDELAQDSRTPRGKCGYMRFCDYCTDCGHGRPCVRAFNAYVRENNVKVDYDNLDTIEELL